MNDNDNTRARTQELSLLLRRHQVHGHSPERLDKLLGVAINHAQARNVEVRAAMHGLHHRPAELLTQCEDAITRAQSACDRKDYAEGLRWLKEAQRGLASLRETLEDAAEFDGADADYRRLLALLGSEYLCELPTVRAVAHLLAEAERVLAIGAEADNMLAAGVSRQARFIAGLCREKVRGLQEQKGGGGWKARQLSQLVEEQARYCTETEAFAPAPVADLLMRRAFERLSVLLDEGRVALVARLTEDIESELASRRTVLDAFRRYRDMHGAAAAATVEVEIELKRLIEEESWIRAATYLLQQTLTALSSKAGALKVAAAGALRKFDAFVEETAPAAAAEGPNE